MFRSRPPCLPAQVGSARPVAAAVLAVFLSVVALGPGRADVVGEARVIDGDTIDIGGERVRLWGIDAPESHQSCVRAGRDYACGAAATAWLKDRIRDREVRCAGSDRDRYRRLIAVCFAGGENLNEGMVAAGWALAYRRYSVALVPLEDVARVQRQGLWAGEFVTPWDWKRGDRRFAREGVTVAETAAPPDQR